MSRWKLTLSYDGTGFYGSQRQRDRRSVQEDLECALSRITRQPMSVILAGRTDRGVHAAGQVASCDDLRPDIEGATMVRALNATLADDLGVVWADRVGNAFHARHDARWREYRYRIWSGPRQPMQRHYSWHRTAALDVHAMNDAVQRLQGHRQFATFVGGGEGTPWSARAQQPRSTWRTVYHSSVREVESSFGVLPEIGTSYELRIIADGFLPQMVRAIAGACVDVGRGARPAAWIDELVGFADRRVGPKTAPAHGLVLWRVGYGNDLPAPGPDGTEITVADAANG